LKIPLFDIDWTLMKGRNKVHARAYDYAFRHVYNVPNASKSEINTEGMIDTEILIEVLRLHNVSEEAAKEKMPEAIQAMRDYFVEHQNEEQYIALPGALTTLSELKKKRLLVGLLTGNVEEIGWSKVTKAGLRNFIDFGAFGNLSYKRVDLIEIAKKRAQEAFKLDIPTTDFVIVGDSLLDVACAKLGGIQSIAVASGVHSMDELAIAGADLVISSLQEEERIFAFLNIS
jgi:phosphoglycolate phosphatase